MRMLDLFCGRGGWTNAFLDRGWEVVGVDLVRHPDYRGEFVQANVLTITADYIKPFDFACASSPCEEFSIHGMKHFYPNPKFPDMGLVLFCWTRRQLDLSGVNYVMENVRSARDFVGDPINACGPFLLWGNAVPPLMHQGITKGYSMTREATNLRGRVGHKKSDIASKMATIPPELAHCVAEYAERILGK